MNCPSENTMKHSLMTLLCCILSLRVCAVIANPVPAGLTEEFPVCEVYVNGKKTDSRSSYQHYYQGVNEDGLDEVEVTFNLTLNPLSGNGGRQSFTLYELGNSVTHKMCNITNGPTCLLPYTFSLPAFNNDDVNRNQVNKSPLYIHSDLNDVCYLDILYSEKSVDIKADLTWYKHTDVVYELIIDVQQGFPDPTIGPLLCDGVAVDGVVETKRGGYLITDMDKLRNYRECKVDISNSISTPSFPLPPLPSATQVVTTLPETEKQIIPNDLAIPLLVFCGVVVVIAVVVAAVVAALVYKKKCKAENVTVVNNRIQVEPSPHVAPIDNNEDVTPDHQPCSDTSRPGDNLSTSSGYGDEPEADGGGLTESSSSDNFLSVVDRRPIPETGNDPSESATGTHNCDTSNITSPSDEDKFMPLVDESH